MKILAVVVLLISTVLPMSLLAEDANKTNSTTTGMTKVMKEVKTETKKAEANEAEKEKPEVKKVEEKKPKKNLQTLDSKIVIGQVEHIKITPPRVTLNARIDTGATTTSIDARDITEFERDGKKWVKYTVVNGKKKHELESPIDKTVLIKRHGKEAQERFVIKIRLTAGPVTQLIDVTLADRSEYKYPILIGRNFLKDYFIVDVSRSNILKTNRK